MSSQQSINVKKPYTWFNHNIGGGLAQSTIDCLERFKQANPTIDMSFLKSLGGWRAAASRHTLGQAIDINYDTNGFFICTVGRQIGGEKAALTEVTNPCFAALKRIELKTGKKCDVSARKVEDRVPETYESCWERWNETSSAIVEYLRPLQAAGLPNELTPVMTDNFFKSNVDINDDSIQQLIRDFHALRAPLVFGTPVKNPPKTRNPAKGIMDIPKDVVVGLMNAGFKRWGAVDFGTQSGDLMHFDLG
jgi:hypothetical protein